MDFPVRARIGQCALKIVKSHGPCWLNEPMIRPVLSEREIRAQVVHLNIPYRVAANPAKTCWSAVFLEMERIARRD
jgi:hypothetical protein